MIGATVYKEKRKPDEDKVVEVSDKWFSFIKNVFWLAGLLVVATWKVTDIDNVNNNQTEQIKQLQTDTKQLQTDMSSIKDSQNNQLLMLTRLVAITEARAGIPASVPVNSAKKPVKDH